VGERPWRGPLGTGACLTGDNERGEELDIVFQVRCVLYVLSNEGYQRELVSDSGHGRCPSGHRSRWVAR
jgi:hypothetical protein